MKFSRLFIVMVLLVVLAGLVGCQTPMASPLQQQQQIQDGKNAVDSLKDLNASLDSKLKTIHDALSDFQQVAATQPGGGKLAAEAGKAANAVDQGAAYTQNITAVTNAFVDILKKQQESQATALDKLTTLATTTAQTTHQLAPDSKADNAATLLAVGLLGLSKIVSSITSKQALKSAIETPGTTPAPTETKP